MKRIRNILIVVLVLSLVVAAVGCVGFGPKFELSSLDISPDASLPGDSVTVSANLTNVGGATGDYIAQLSVNGVVEQTQTFTLEPGASQTLSFTLNKDEPGGYVAQLEELTTSFTVLGASNLQISPSEVEPDEPVTVTADLQNVAETQASYRCCLLCDGKEVEAKDITVAGASTEKVSFALSQATSGTYFVELLGLSGSFMVFNPAEFEILSMGVVPNPVKVGEEVTIVVDILNVGEVEGTYSAALAVNGMVEQTQDVTVAGFMSAPATFLCLEIYPVAIALK